MSIICDILKVQNFERIIEVFGKIKKWFSNYWYYYKWPVIMISAFATIIGICIFQSASKEKYDVSVLYTGPHMFEVSEKENLSSAFEQLMGKDYNGDGKRVVDVIDMPAFTDEQIEAELNGATDETLLVKYAPYTVAAVKNSFSQMVSSSDASICFVDKYWYDIMKDAGRLMELEGILGYRPDCLIDEYSVYLSDLAIYDYFSESVGKLPDDTIVCFKKMSSASAFIGKKEADKMYENSKEMLKTIFAFEMPS